VQKLAVLEAWGKVPEGARLSVRIEAWMPDRRRRDLDNLMKSTLDSITHAGVWEDDSQIDHLSIRRVPTLGGMLKVQIAEVAE
jgi:crossover junction endodeoxyribonuclease RusA